MDAARSYRPISAVEIESDKFEEVGVPRGEAGKLRGGKIGGGTIFAASEFPNPPLTPSHNMELFEKAARNRGYQSFSVPASDPRVPTRKRARTSR